MNVSISVGLHRSEVLHQSSDAEKTPHQLDGDHLLRCYATSAKSLEAMPVAVRVNELIALRIITLYASR